jgi:preprotein translocase YajC subunit
MLRKRNLAVLLVTLLVIVLMLSLFTGCVTNNTEDAGEQGWFARWGIFLMIVPLMLLMVVPQMMRSRKARKAQAERMTKLSRGDKVMLNDGVYGVIDAVDNPNNTVIVNIGCGEVPVLVKLNIAGIYRIIEPEEEQAAEDRRKQAEKEKEEEAEKPPAPMSADDLEIERRREEKRAAKLARKTGSTVGRENCPLSVTPETVDEPETDDE